MPPSWCGRSGTDRLAFRWTHFLSHVIRPGVGTHFRDLSSDFSRFSVRRSGARDRRHLILRPADSPRKILEIGPLDKPIASSGGFDDVYYSDRLSRRDLRDAFGQHPNIDPDKIVDVHFVDRTGNLLEAVPAAHHGSFDLIIASHVLEHIPNPLAFILSLVTLLKPDGRIALALPDKRFCFDVFRPLTTTSAWLEASLEDRRKPSRRSLFDASAMAVAKDLSITWSRPGGRIDDLTFSGMALHDAYATFFLNNDDETENDRDCHSGVYIPQSFALIIEECHSLGLIPFRIAELVTNSNAEFFVHLEKNEHPSLTHHDRLQLLALIANEEARSFSAIRPAPPPRPWSRLKRYLLRRFE